LRFHVRTYKRNSPFDKALCVIKTIIKSAIRQRRTPQLKTKNSKFKTVSTFSAANFLRGLRVLRGLKNVCAFCASSRLILAVKSVKSYEPEPVNVFFVLSPFVSLLSGSAFFTRRPLRQKLRGRGVKNAAGFYFRLAAHTPIRAHHKNDGTQNCLRQKGPILSDVISANGGLTLRRPGSFL